MPQYLEKELTAEQVSGFGENGVGLSQLKELAENIDFTPSEVVERFNINEFLTEIEYLDDEYKNKKKIKKCRNAIFKIIDLIGSYLNEDEDVKSLFSLGADEIDHLKMMFSVGKYSTYKA